MSVERTPTLYVTVWVGDLTTGGERRIPATRSTVDERDGRDAVVEASEHDTELTATFVLDAVTEDEARVAGSAVLDAVDADDDSVWTVTVLEHF